MFVYCMQHNMKEDVANIIAPLMVRPITRWPFFAFLGGAMFCLLASSVCHLLSCHSERMAYIMLRLDYAGIAALISTSFYPPVYYSFMCNPFFCNLYLISITVLGIATILFSLLPVFQNPEFRTIRASPSPWCSHQSQSCHPISCQGTTSCLEPAAALMVL